MANNCIKRKNKHKIELYLCDSSIFFFSTILLAFEIDRMVVETRKNVWKFENDNDKNNNNNNRTDFDQRKTYLILSILYDKTLYRLL